jgi:hypothetical protein
MQWFDVWLYVVQAVPHTRKFCKDRKQGNVYNSDSTLFIAFLHWMTTAEQFSGGEYFQS